MRSNQLFRTYAIVLGLVIGVMLIFEMTKTPITDWSKNFDEDSKTPFGLYIFDQEADSLFHGKLIRTSESPYQFEPKDSTKTRNYLIIGKQISDQTATYKLLKEVEKGSSIFYSSPYYFDFSPDDEDSIYYYYSSDRIYVDSIQLEFASKKISTPVKLKHIESLYVLDSITPNVKPLGIFKNGKSSNIFFGEFPYGKGKIYYLTTPELFTNYGILNAQNHQVIPKILGYLPDQETIWFQNRSEIKWKAGNHSILRVIFENPTLTWAWRLLLLGLLIFMIFTAKRKQRIIPIIPPVKNESAEFVKNISNLYIQEGNAKDMAQKKALYFLQKVRSELYIPTNDLNEKFIERLQIKTMQPHETIQEAVRLLQKATHPQAPMQEDELIKMNKILDQIYKS